MIKWDWLRLRRAWYSALKGMQGKYGYYKGRPVTLAIHSIFNPCAGMKVPNQSTFTWLFDFCMEARRLYRMGVPPDILREAYEHFRKNPHFKPKEVEKYVKERYEKQNRSYDAYRKRSGNDDTV